MISKVDFSTAKVFSCKNLCYFKKYSIFLSNKSFRLITIFCQKQIKISRIILEIINYFIKILDFFYATRLVVIFYYKLKKYLHALFIPLFCARYNNMNIKIKAM